MDFIDFTPLPCAGLLQVHEHEDEALAVLELGHGLDDDRAAGVGRELGHDLATLLQRCPAFVPEGGGDGGLL